MTDTTKPDLFSLVELGGGGNSEKWGICNLWTGDQIVMEFDIEKDLVL